MTRIQGFEFRPLGEPWFFNGGWGRDENRQEFHVFEERDGFIANLRAPFHPVTPFVLLGVQPKIDLIPNGHCMPGAAAPLRTRAARGDGQLGEFLIRIGFLRNVNLRGEPVIRARARSVGNLIIHHHHTGSIGTPAAKGVFPVIGVRDIRLLPGAVLILESSGAAAGFESPGRALEISPAVVLEKKGAA